MIKKSVFFLSILTIYASCQSKNNQRDALVVTQSTDTHKVIFPPYPEGLSIIEAHSIADTTSLNFVITRLRSETGERIWFGRRLTESAEFLLLDSLSIAQDTEYNLLIGQCAKTGQDIAQTNLLAYVKPDTTKELSDVSQAWVADMTSLSFLSIVPSGIRCINNSF